VIIFQGESQSRCGHGSSVPKSTPAGFCIFCGPGSGVKNLWKTGSGVTLSFRQYQESACLYKCHCLSTSVAEFRLRRWLPESDPISGPWFKIFGTGAVSGVWKCASGHLCLNSRNLTMADLFSQSRTSRAASVLPSAKNVENVFKLSGIFTWHCKNMKT